MSEQEVTDVINEIIKTVNLLNDKVNVIEEGIVKKLIEINSCLEQSQKDVAGLLSGVIDLLQSVTEKEFRVNDFILGITELVISHKEAREKAGEIIE